MHRCALNIGLIAALRMFSALLACLPLVCLSGCPAPWADREAVLIETLRTEEEKNRGDFVIEDGKIIFERRQVARYNVVEDTIDGRRVFIFHGKKDGDAYFAVLGAECSACGSLISYDVNRRDFRCPFCGSRYDHEGRPTFGPAKALLERWEVEMVSDQIVHITLKRDPKYTSEAPGRRT